MSSHREIQQQNHSENGIHGDAFNEDFLYPIFDIADLEQILQHAKVSRTSDFVINHIFPVEYQNYIFNLVIDNDDNVYMTADSLHIPNFHFFIDVITHFGKYIKNIGIIRPELLNEGNTAGLCQCISEHCSDSLYFLYLLSINGDIFTHFTNSFPKMKRLRFHVRTDDVASILPFDELFPNLEFLLIDYYDSHVNQNNTNRFIEIELPFMEHLKCLNVSIDIIYKRSQPDIAIIHNQLGNMMQKNPQIERLWYGSILNNFIQEINKYLPNLEHFGVRSLDANIQPVHFDNVKYFHVEFKRYMSCGASVIFTFGYSLYETMAEII